MKKYVTLVFIFIFVTLSAQKMKITDGNFDFLKGQKEINVEFVYDNMKLLKKNLSQQQYVKEHSAELEEKSKGKGKTWEKKMGRCSGIDLAAKIFRTNESLFL